MLSVCVDDAVRCRRVVHRSGGEAVAGFGGSFDASVSNELSEGGADGRVSRRGACADLSLRERLVGFGEDLDDPLLSGLRRRHGLDRHLPAKPQRRPLTVVGEFGLDVVEAASGAMLEGHHDLVVPAAQVRFAAGTS